MILDSRLNNNKTEDCRFKNLEIQKSLIINPKSFKPGFTLIEMLVVIIILSMVAGISSSIFLSIIRSNNKSNVINEIQQNGNITLQTLEAAIRNARYVRTAPGAAGLTLDLIDKDNRTVYYRIASGTGGMGVIQKSNDNVTWDTITNSNTVTGITVLFSASSPGQTNPFVSSNFYVTSGNPQSVIITLTLSQGTAAPGRIDYQSTTTLKTTVSLRNY